MDVTLLLVRDKKGVHFLWDSTAVKSTPSKTVSYILYSMFVNVCVRAISATCIALFFSYPSGTEKLAIAKEIVSLFPSLRIQVPFGENLVNIIKWIT